MNNWRRLYGAPPLSAVASNGLLSSTFPGLGAARTTGWLATYSLVSMRVTALPPGTQLLSTPRTNAIIAGSFSTRRKVGSSVENVCPLQRRSRSRPALKPDDSILEQKECSLTDPSTDESDHLGIPGNKPGDKPRKFGPKPGEPEPNWGEELRKKEGGPPEEMILPHAHHAVFKMGRGALMKSFLNDSKDILEHYEIDWYRGFENLGWAPNKNHSTAVAEVVRDKLLEAHREYGTREAVVEELARLKAHFRNDTIKDLIGNRPTEG